ncbi:MAG: carboxypeptidase regulatory-like domain-containing protein [bacterium]|nr:carboxypeptidase regulatory-like domain-containing protein [bacterium]
MRILTIVPIASLVGLGVTLLLALRGEEASDQPEVQLPTGELTPHVEPELGGASLVGTVIDAERAPIPGASIGLVLRGRPLWTHAAADGSFRLDEVDRGPCRVRVLAQGWPAQVLDTVAGEGAVELVLGAPLPEQPSFPAIESASLSGMIDPGIGSADAEGYEIVLLPTGNMTEYGTGKPRRATTDADGRFRFDALERVEYRVLALPPWAAGGTWPDLLTGWDGRPELYDHEQAGETPPPLPLNLLGGIIEGTLRDDRGRLLEGGLIEVTPLTDADAGSPRTLPTARTDANGRYRLHHVPPGRYAVRATAGPHVRETTVLVPTRGRVDPGL